MQINGKQHRAAHRVTNRNAADGKSMLFENIGGGGKMLNVFLKLIAAATAAAIARSFAARTAEQRAASRAEQ